MKMNKRNRLSDQEIKKVELDALIYIRQICQEYHLRYYLAYGTLLGLFVIKVLYLGMMMLIF